MSETNFVIKQPFYTLESGEIEVSFDPKREVWLVKIYQYYQPIAELEFKKEHLKEDIVVDALLETGIEFSSASALYEAAEIIISSSYKTKKMFETATEGKSRPKEEKPLQISQPSVTKEQESLPSTGQKETRPAETSSAMAETATTTPSRGIDRADLQLLEEFEIPYSNNAKARVYYDKNAKKCYFEALIEDTPVISLRQLPSDKIEDTIVKWLNDSDIELISFSTIYDTAEKVEKLAKNAENVLEELQATAMAPSVEEQQTEHEMVDESEYLPTTQVSGKKKTLSLDELEIPNLDEFKTADDVDRLITLLKESVNTEKPILVAEIPLKSVSSAYCQIYRTGDNAWYLAIKQPRTQVPKLVLLQELTVEEIIKILNNQVDQISISALATEADPIFQQIKHLAKRPLDDLVLKKAVDHFSSLIKQYESEGNKQEAFKIAKALYEKFVALNNPEGILEFGILLAEFYKKSNKIPAMIQVYKEIFESLLQIKSVPQLKKFIETVIEIFRSPEVNRPLDAASYAQELTDLTISDKDELGVALEFARLTIELYKAAELTVSVVELALSYAEQFVEYLKQAEEDTTIATYRQQLVETLDWLFNEAIEAQISAKDPHGLREVLQKIFLLLDSTSDFILLEKYYPKIISLLETEVNDLPKAIEVGIKAIEFFMDNKELAKALEYVNLVIRYYYAIDAPSENIAVLIIEVGEKLVKMKEVKIALQYFDFLNQLFAKKKPKTENFIEETYLRIANLFLEVNMDDYAISYFKRIVELNKGHKNFQEKLLKIVTKFLEEKQAKYAQELINFEITRLLEEKKTEDAGHLSEAFAHLLLKYKLAEIAFDYLKYAGQCYYHIKKYEKVEKCLKKGIKKLLSETMIQKAIELQNILTQIYMERKEYTRAISDLKLFVDGLLEMDKTEIAYKILQQIPEIHEKMNDPEGGIESLLEYQEVFLEKDLKLGKELTTKCVNELINRFEDYKLSTQALEKLIETLLKKEEFGEAYYYILQITKYYENINELDKAYKLLEKYQQLTYEKGDSENYLTIVDFMVRFLRVYKPKKLSSYLETVLENAVKFKSFDYVVTFSVELIKEKMAAKHFNDALTIAEKYIEILLDHPLSDFGSLAELYLKLLDETGRKPEEIEQKVHHIVLKRLQVGDDPQSIIKIIDTHLKLLHAKNNMEKLIANLKSYAKILIENDHAQLSLDYIETAWNLLSEQDMNEALQFIEDTILLLLDFNAIKESEKIVQLWINASSEETERLGRKLKYIKFMAQKGLLQEARRYVQQIIAEIKRSNVPEKNELLAGICARFALLAANKSDALVIEYAYQAHDYYRRNHDYNSILKLYQNLSQKLEDFNLAHKLLQKAISSFKVLPGTQTYTAELRFELAKLYIRFKRPDTEKIIKQCLEEYENLQDIDLLAKKTAELMEFAANEEYFDVIIQFLAYIQKLIELTSTQNYYTDIFKKAYLHYKKQQNEAIIAQLKQFKERTELKIDLDELDKKFAPSIEPIREVKPITEEIMIEKTPPEVTSAPTPTPKAALSEETHIEEHPQMETQIPSEESFVDQIEDYEEELFALPEAETLEVTTPEPNLEPASQTTTKVEETTPIRETPLIEELKGFLEEPSTTETTSMFEEEKDIQALIDEELAELETAALPETKAISPPSETEIPSAPTSKAETTQKMPATSETMEIDSILKQEMEELESIIAEETEGEISAETSPTTVKTEKPKITLPDIEAPQQLESLSSTKEMPTVEPKVTSPLSPSSKETQPTVDYSSTETELFESSIEEDLSIEDDLERLAANVTALAMETDQARTVETTAPEPKHTKAVLDEDVFDEALSELDVLFEKEKKEKKK